MIEKSEVEAAAKELNIKEQKNEEETRGTPEKQQGVVEKLQPAEQAKTVEENKGEQKQEQLKTQDDAVDAHARESFAKLADEVLDIRFGDYVDMVALKEG